jgi:hypothetical protein
MRECLPAKLPAVRVREVAAAAVFEATRVREVVDMRDW